MNDDDHGYDGDDDDGGGDDDESTWQICVDIVFMEDSDGASPTQK